MHASFSGEARQSEIPFTRANKYEWLYRITSRSETNEYFNLYRTMLTAVIQSIMFVTRVKLPFVSLLIFYPKLLFVFAHVDGVSELLPGPPLTVQDVHRDGGRRGVARVTRVRARVTALSVFDQQVRRGAVAFLSDDADTAPGGAERYHLPQRGAEGYHLLQRELGVLTCCRDELKVITCSRRQLKNIKSRRRNLHVCIYYRREL